MEKSAKIYIAGHHGLVGSAIWRNLQEKGYTNLTGRSHKELDLLDGVAVKDFFDQERPEYVILAAAHVGGIMANSTYRADFIYKNLQIQQNVIGESFRHGVKKLLFLGSTCIYPNSCNLVTSVSLRMVPSGFSGLNVMLPLYPVSFTIR
jgi:GDP-L-fucose synthase